MRQRRTVDLGGGDTAVLLEMTPQDVRQLVSVLPQDLSTLTVSDLARDTLPDVLEAIRPCVELPDGRAIGELGMSELHRLFTAWWEMHADFFALLAPLVASRSATSAPSVTSGSASSTTAQSPLSAPDITSA